MNGHKLTGIDMKRSTKKLLGVLSFYTPSVLVGFLLFGLIQFLWFSAGLPALNIDPLWIFFSVIMIGVATTWVLVPVFIVLTLRNKALIRSEKIAWIFGIVILNWIFMPAYWYVNIWKEMPTMKTGPEGPAQDLDHIG
jgi:hypothetical protein